MFNCLYKIQADVYGDQVNRFYDYLHHKVRICNIMYGPSYIDAPNASSILVADRWTHFEVKSYYY